MSSYHIDQHIVFFITPLFSDEERPELFQDDYYEGKILAFFWDEIKNSCYYVVRFLANGQEHMGVIQETHILGEKDKPVVSLPVPEQTCSFAALPEFLKQNLFMTDGVLLVYPSFWNDARRDISFGIVYGKERGFCRDDKENQHGNLRNCNHEQEKCMYCDHYAKKENVFHFHLAKEVSFLRSFDENLLHLYCQQYCVSTQTGKERLEKSVWWPIDHIVSSFPDEEESSQ